MALNISVVTVKGCGGRQEYPVGYFRHQSHQVAGRVPEDTLGISRKKEE